MKRSLSLNLAVFIIACCGVLAALPSLAEQKAPQLSDVILVGETSPIFPGMYCVASYMIIHDQLIGLDNIPPIVAKDIRSRGANLAVFLQPLALEVEQLSEDEFLAELKMLKSWLVAYGDGHEWLVKARAYGCRSMTEQWALIKDPIAYDTPL